MMWRNAGSAVTVHSYGGVIRGQYHSVPFSVRTSLLYLRSVWSPCSRDEEYVPVDTGISSPRAFIREQDTALGPNIMLATAVSDTLYVHIYKMFLGSCLPSDNDAA